MKIVWTQKAINENNQNINYLIQEWEKKVLVNYIDKLDTVINLLSKNPNIGQYDKEIGSYKILVVNQIYLFYELNIKDNTLIILSFWNNYKRPFWL